MCLEFFYRVPCIRQLHSRLDFSLVELIHPIPPSIHSTQVELLIQSDLNSVNNLSHLSLLQCFSIPCTMMACSFEVFPDGNTGQLVCGQRVQPLNYMSRDLVN